MKKNILILLVFAAVSGCVRDKKIPLAETDFQRRMNAEFKDAAESPLKEKDRKSFKGLDFFKFDEAYVVTADFKRTPDEKVFKMKTTTGRLPVYVKYGEVSFTLKGRPHRLNVYQNQELIKKEGYENYLFLPFLDGTNGETTYGGGRYIDVSIPEGDTMEIDFNKAYNPYCAYNEKYSCPIVPRENYIAVKIEAGVKNFKK